MRFELNPSKCVLSDAIAKLDKIFPNLLGCILVNGKFTRFDLAVDIPDFDYLKHLYLLKWGRKYNTCKGENSETLYIGSKRSKLQVCIYDKNAELRLATAEPLLSRVEFRLRNGFRIDDLKKIVMSGARRLLIASPSKNGSMCELVRSSAGVDAMRNFKPRDKARRIADLGFIPFSEFIGEHNLQVGIDREITRLVKGMDRCESVYRKNPISRPKHRYTAPDRHRRHSMPKLASLPLQ